MPTQLGPTKRKRWGRAASSIACRRARPDAPCSPKPAPMTTAARVPRVPSSAISPGTVSGGVAITARSGTSGRLAMSRWTGTPPIDRWSGLTSISGPPKAPRRRLRESTAPSEPWRGVAPIRATAPGLKSLSRLRTDI